MEHLVSVIIPVYKVEQYLDRCLNSIVGQTYTNLEIILVDDGSPDLCPKMCDDWAKKDSRIKVIHKDNDGVGMARNCGLDVSSGAYVMFVDSDDYLPLDAIQLMIKCIAEDDSDLVIGQSTKVYPDGTCKPTYRYDSDHLILDKDDAFKRLGSQETPFSIYLWDKLYKRGVLENVRFCKLKTAEDVRAIPDIIENCDKISLLNRVVYYYFQRENSIVHTMTKEKHIDNVNVVLYVARFLYERNYIKEARLYYNSAICQYLMIKDKEVKNIISSSFNSKERRVLRTNKGIKMWLTLIKYRFPNLYGIYKKIKNKSTV